MDTSLSGKTALITGGSLGLGRAMAAAFYAEGAKVAIVARRQAPLDEAAKEIAATDGGEIAAFACDVSDPKQVVETHAAVIERFGHVDILVNNAGQSAAKPFTEITDEDWQADIDLKLMAAVRLSRLVWPHMEDQKWGRISMPRYPMRAPDRRLLPERPAWHSLKCCRQRAHHITFW